MPNSFLGLVWQSFVRLHGIVLGVLALGISIILWIFKPETTVALSVVLPVGLVVAILLAVVIDAGFAAWRQRTPGLPKVLYAAGISIPGVDKLKLVCLLEPSELFSYGLQVAFYYQNEDGFEILVGVGRVLNIQDDRRVQVGLTHFMEGQSENVEKIRQNSKTVLERVRVKPSLPHDAMTTALREEEQISALAGFPDEQQPGPADTGEEK